MRRVYFNAGNIEGIQKIRVFGSLFSDRGFAYIDDYAYSPSKDYVDIDSVAYFFKLSFIINGKATAYTNTVISDDFGRIIEVIRNELDDTNIDDPAFTDDEYIIKILFETRRYKGVDDISLLAESDYSVIQKMVMKDCCYPLAYVAAKYTKITLPDNISLNKGERVAHYLAIAKALTEELKDILSDIGDDAGNGISVIQNTKKSYFRPRAY